MPIRINLLAESQAAEELRRKDPTKMALRIGVGIIVAVLIWSGSLQLRLVSESLQLSRLQDSMSNKANGYATVISNEQALAQANARLAAIHDLTGDRFLEANLLNALQRTTADGIQLTRLNLDQTYGAVAEEKPRVENGVKIPGKPAGNQEKILLTLEAKDTSANPGDVAINHYKEAIAASPYFQQQHMSTNDILLRNLSSAEVDADTGRPFVTFVLECHYPDTVR